MYFTKLNTYYINVPDKIKYIKEVFFMSELMIYKSNELAVSRYDLTEHETKLILCGVSLLNPTLEHPTRDDRTIKLGYQEYAQIMGLSFDNAYHRLNKATSKLMTKTIEIVYPEGKISKHVFQWVNSAKFNREDQSLELVFSEDIIPYLFHLKKFIKYNLEHVKAFENKYSMRVYEWLLKELTQRKTHKINIQISITEFKFMLMLETRKSYNQFFEFNRKVLTPISKDINRYSDMKLVIDKKGRPADTLIFQVEIDKEINLSTKTDAALCKIPPRERKSVKNQNNDKLYMGIENTLTTDSISKIKLSSFEMKFLTNMKSKYNLNGSFSWLTEKQRTTLEKILAKYGQI